MLKKLLLAVAVALPMFASAQTVKLGLVDTNAIIGQMPETAEAQKKINEVSKRLDTEYNSLGEEMKRKLDEYQNMKADEPAAIKDRKTRELSEYQQKIQNFEKQAMNDLQKLQQDLMAPIMKKVNDAIQAVGMEGNYTLIQDKNPQIVLYFGAPAIDITNDVKNKLGIKGTATTAPAAK